jgi:hypothetical protein
MVKAIEKRIRIEKNSAVHKIFSDCFGLHY